MTATSPTIRRALPALGALLGAVLLSAGPAPGADTLVLTARGELKEPAVAVPAVARRTAPSSVMPAAVPELDAADPAAAPPAEEAAPEDAGPAPYIYQARGLRDPFSLPAEVRSPATSAETVPPLQRHALSDFRLVAVVRAPRGPFAMVTTADGKGYTVREGTRIGTDNGKVKRITKNAVVIEVVQPDEFGELKKSETVMALRPEEVVP